LFFAVRCPPNCPTSQLLLGLQKLFKLVSERRR